MTQRREKEEVEGERWWTSTCVNETSRQWERNEARLRNGVGSGHLPETDTTLMPSSQVLKLCTHWTLNITLYLIIFHWCGPMLILDKVKHCSRHQTHWKILQRPHLIARYMKYMSRFFPARYKRFRKQLLWNHCPKKCWQHRKSYPPQRKGFTACKCPVTGKAIDVKQRTNTGRVCLFTQETHKNPSPEQNPSPDAHSWDSKDGTGATVFEINTKPASAGSNKTDASLITLMATQE